MEKMIEEMAKVVEAMSYCEGYADNRGCYFANSCKACQNANREKSIEIAKRLTKQGYRKVVMCKDCKISDFGYFEKEIGKEAIEGYYCRKYREMKLPNDFCSDGVKKGAE